MTFLQRQYRKRLSLALALGMLAAYYVLVFRPLLLRERAQQEPFEVMQQELRAVAENNSAVSGLALNALDKLETDLQQSLVVSGRATGFIKKRFAPEPAIATNLSRAWQLIDYQNERQRRAIALEEKAAEKGVRIEPAVMAGLPELTADTVRKELLWAQLGLVDSILKSAVEMGVTTVEDVLVPPPIVYPARTNAASQLVEVPIRVQFSGDWGEITRTLGVLLLDAEDRGRLGLTSPGDLPGMSLRHIIARKGPPDGPSTVQLEVEFAGFLMVPVQYSAVPIKTGN